VRFRYGQPEKIGGWLQVSADTLIGVARAQHVFTDLDGRKYAAIGTNRCLYIYYSGDLYDITPIDPARQQTGADITTTNGSTTVTITTTSSHNLQIGDIVTFENAGSFTGRYKQITRLQILMMYYLKVKNNSNSYNIYN